MNVDTAAAFLNLNPDTLSTVLLTDGTAITGTVTKVDPKKGVSIKVKDTGKIVVRALSKVDTIKRADEPEEPLTTAQVAELFDISAKELRVHLRAMGIGVGQGRRYSFDQTAIKAVREHLAAEAEKAKLEAAAADMAVADTESAGTINA